MKGETRVKKFPTEEQVKRLLSWKELTLAGAITNPGSTRFHKTGSWRVKSPKWIKEKCTHCLLCALYCPENAIPVENGKRGETNLDYCKGCGICARVCPVKAIEMVEE